MGCLVRFWMNNLHAKCLVHIHPLNHSALGLKEHEVLLNELTLTMKQWTETKFQAKLSWSKN
jgi:hypothetical protein